MEREECTPGKAVTIRRGLFRGDIRGVVLPLVVVDVQGTSMIWDPKDMEPYPPRLTEPMSVGAHFRPRNDDGGREYVRSDTPGRPWIQIAGSLGNRHPWWQWTWDEIMEREFPA